MEYIQSREHHKSCILQLFAIATSWWQHAQAANEGLQRLRALVWPGSSPGLPGAGSEAANLVQPRMSGASGRSALEEPRIHRHGDNVSMRHKVRARKRKKEASEGVANAEYHSLAAAESPAPRSGGRKRGKVASKAAHNDQQSGRDSILTQRADMHRPMRESSGKEQDLLEAVDAALQVDGALEHARAAPLPGQLHRVRKWSGNPNDYKLTKERVAAVAKDGMVLLSWANHHYLDFAMNWVGHMQQLNISAYMLGAMDNDLLQALVEMNVNNTFAMQTGLEQGDLSWGSPHFFQMGREKIQLIEKFTSMGFDVIVSDIDTVWMRDPLAYMARFPDADILASSDHIANTTNDDGLEKFPDAGSPCNIGILLFRKSALEFAKEWNLVLSKDDLYWDQNAFNDLFRRGMDFYVNRPDRLFRGYDRKLLVGILPVALFASGHTFYVQDLAKQMGLQPYVAHGTFQYSGTPGKRHRFRERMVWLADGPEYYDPPGGLLSFDFRVDHLVEDASKIKFTGELDDLMGHFKLVNAQLTQIRNALAISTALGRTLIIPKMMTGADRWWAPHRGLIPGTVGMKFPMFCPADYILDLDMMARDWSEAEFGPNTPFREYSFLDNPRTPAKVATETLEVRMCKSWEKDCTDDSQRPKLSSGGLNLQYGLNDKQLRSIFQTYNATKVLHFDDLSSGFGGFQSNEDSIKFERRTKVYASIWCCVDKHPGHVWYDMWWDSGSHQDRHGRTIDKWVPLTGP